jgi:hypothetical protein
MRTAFKQIPGPLQTQIIIRLGLGALFFVLLIALQFMARDVTLWLPCAVAAVFFAASAFSLFRRAVSGEYVVVTGACSGVGLTVARRRAKHIILQTGEHTLQVTLKNRTRKISAGAVVNLYLAKNTPIYDKDGVQVLYTYLAMELKQVGRAGQSCTARMTFA